MDDTEQVEFLGPAGDQAAEPSRRSPVSLLSPTNTDFASAEISQAASLAHGAASFISLPEIHVLRTFGQRAHRQQAIICCSEKLLLRTMGPAYLDPSVRGLPPRRSGPWWHHFGLVQTPCRRNLTSAECRGTTGIFGKGRTDSSRVSGGPISSEMNHDLNDENTAYLLDPRGPRRVPAEAGRKPTDPFAGRCCVPLRAFAWPIVLALTLWGAHCVIHQNPPRDGREKETFTLYGDCISEVDAAASTEGCSISLAILYFKHIFEHPWVLPLQSYFMLEPKTSQDVRPLVDVTIHTVGPEICSHSKVSADICTSENNPALLDSGLCRASGPTVIIRYDTRSAYSNIFEYGHRGSAITDHPSGALEWCRQWSLAARGERPFTGIACRRQSRSRPVSASRHRTASTCSNIDTASFRPQNTLSVGITQSLSAEDSKNVQHI
ncbi:hypothetical protein DFH06DRAFT_1134044 [Mycena polygramma]|nr:hypothetical protein DFH06DRAFT_1134044 [Mycena polygramma]